MNNYRRKLLSQVSSTLETIQGEVDVLAADEATGDKESEEARDKRVKGWQGKLSNANDLVEQVKDEEEESAENTRSEDKKAEMEEAVSELEECLGDLQELADLEDLGSFNEMWNSKYESMISNLENASQ